ncbi:MAG TPA: hemolysin [Rikenellaceae bacterium]|nr:hemolysin [Rikenellaceae bacterium]
MALLLVYLLGAMSISFLCSVLEATLMSTPISYITMREDEGYKPATKFKQFKQESSRPIAAILSLNTIANTIGAAGVGAQATEVFGSKWFGLVSAITTVLILVFSEIIPKTIGTTRWKSLMGFATRIISVLIVIMYPLVILVEGLTKLITPKDQEAAVSREEVSAMANVAEEEGDLEEDENAIIQNLINMDEVTAAEAMTPRVVCATAPESMTMKAFYKDKSFLHHSRIPVYEKDDEYITGYILRMDALQLLAEDKFDRTLGSIKREIASFREDTPLDQIWDEMLSKDEQIAVIIDEYGGFQGILTLEDVIETLLGSEIVDEKDSVRDMQQFAKDRWRKLNPHAKVIEPIEEETTENHND